MDRTLTGQMFLSLELPTHLLLFPEIIFIGLKK